MSHCSSALSQDTRHVILPIRNLMKSDPAPNVLSSSGSKSACCDHDTVARATKMPETDSENMYSSG